MGAEWRRNWGSMRRRGWQRPRPCCPTLLGSAAPGARVSAKAQGPVAAGLQPQGPAPCSGASPPIALLWLTGIQRSTRSLSLQGEGGFNQRVAGRKGKSSGTEGRQATGRRQAGSACCRAARPAPRGSLRCRCGRPLQLTHRCGWKGRRRAYTNDLMPKRLAAVVSARSRFLLWWWWWWWPCSWPGRGGGQPQRLASRVTCGTHTGGAARPPSAPLLASPHGPSPAGSASNSTHTASGAPSCLQAAQSSWGWPSGAWVWAWPWSVWWWCAWSPAQQAATRGS